MVEKERSKSETEAPLVTFALFAYNQEQYIRKAIEGVFSQDYENLEIILSDDCSSDSTFEIMEELSSNYSGDHEVRLRRNDSNLGLADHINEIISELRGEFIFLAAGFDVSMPDRTRNLVTPVIENKSVSGVHSTVCEIDCSGNLGEFRVHSKEIHKPMVDSVIRTGLGGEGQAHPFRLDVFGIFGPTNEDLTYESPAMAFRESFTGTSSIEGALSISMRSNRRCDDVDQCSSR